MKAILVVFLGGGIGAVIRFLISKGTFYFYEGNFPLGTFISNTISCVIVGALVYLLAMKTNFERNMSLFIITGICGGLSTFSTFSYETVELLRQGFWSVALLNVLLSLVVGMVIMFAFYYKSIT